LLSLSKQAGIQLFQSFLDAGLRRHDDVDVFFTITTQSPAEDKKGALRVF
jgi:hypothetical protein